MKVRTRFAPSPTGYVHIGNLRTALYNHLFARHHKGTVVLRIEDTDRERHVPGAMEHLILILEQVGLDYDEGPGKDGPFGPYIQSERSEVYQDHARLLVEKRHAYYCFCSNERLGALRAEQKEQKAISKYDRKCLTLSSAECDERLKKGERAVIRLRIPDNEVITFEDSIRGTISVHSNEIDDQVLLKSDGMPTYHLANVVDDHLMEITHVIRGEDWIPSTPKHVALYRAFGWVMPVFAHVPLLLNPDKTKLSKRQGDVSVEDFLAQGYLPQALINFIALLGWNPRSDQERYTLEELIELFDISKVNKSGAVLNKEKLDWLNHEYLLGITDKEFIAHAEPFLKSKAYAFPAGFKNFAQWARVEKQRIKKMNEVGEETRCLFIEPTFENPSLLVWKKSTQEKTVVILAELEVFFDSLPEHDILDDKLLEEHIKQWIEEKHFERGDVLWPLRVALSGAERSPGPFELAALLGKKVVCGRIHNARVLLA